MPEFLVYPNWLYLAVGFLIGIIFIRFWRTIVGFVLFVAIIGVGYVTFRERVPQPVEQFVQSAIDFDNLPAPPALPTFELVELIAPHSETPQPTPTLVESVSALATLTPTPEPIPFAFIDAHALNVPDSAEVNLDSLAAYLNSGAKTESERARAIYRWMTAEIDYDAEALFSGDYAILSAEEVLASRTAICTGYSNMFEALANRMGLETVEVIGHSKGYTSAIGELDDVNHAWNAVKIDGQWELVDVTWGSGYLNDAGQFVESFNPHYFLTPPEQFVADHLPEDTEWQLLAEPISAETFTNAPDLSPAFYNFGLLLNSHTSGILSADNRIDVSIGAPDNVIMLASVAQNGVRLDRALTFVEREANTIRVSAHFPAAGLYELQLFAKERGAEGEFPYVASYRVEAAGGAADFRFPQQFATFSENSAKLIAPQSGILQQNATYTFEVSAPNALDVALIDGENWTFAERDGDIFRVTAPVLGERVQLSAKYSAESRTYSGLVAYEVRP